MSKDDAKDPKEPTYEDYLERYVHPPLLLHAFFFLDRMLVLTQLRGGVGFITATSTTTMNGNIGMSNPPFTLPLSRDPEAMWY